MAWCGRGNQPVQMYVRGACALGVACGCLLTTTRPALAGSDPWDGPIANAGALADWSAAARSSRADMVMLGDSNQLFAGYGWDGAFITVMDSRIGVYASGLHWCGENNGLGRGVGEGVTTINSGGTSSGFSFSGAPADLDQFARLYDPLVGSEYLYLPSGLTLPGARQVGMYLTGTLDRTAALRYWLVDGIFDSGAGLYTPYIRIGQSPWTTVAQFDAINTVGLQFEVRTNSYAIPANPARTAPLEFRFAPTWFSPGFVGPLFLLWQRLEQVDAPGVSLHTLYAYGGKSARFMANTLANASDEMLGAYFTEVRRLQPADSHHTLIRIHQGLNDRNETLPSVRNAILPGDSPEAYVDNIASTIDRIRAVWSGRGFADDELTFLIVTPFNVAEPQDPDLVAYRNAVAELVTAYPRLAVIDQAGLIPYQTMVASNHFANSIDRNHLSISGYLALVTAETEFLLATYCLADIDNNGGIDGGDLAAFFLLFEAGDADADLDKNGGVDGGDLATFFQHFESGC